MVVGLGSSTLAHYTYGTNLGRLWLSQVSPDESLLSFELGLRQAHCSTSANSICWGRYRTLKQGGKHQRPRSCVEWPNGVTKSAKSINWPSFNLGLGTNLCHRKHIDEQVQEETRYSCGLKVTIDESAFSSVSGSPKIIDIRATKHICHNKERDSPRSHDYNSDLC